jgi:hypothetical protein
MCAGLTLITTLYSLSHRKACPDCGRYLGDALLSMVFIFLLSLLWIRAQKLDAVRPRIRYLVQFRREVLEIGGGVRGP